MNRLSRLLPAYRLCGNNIKLLQPQNLGLVRYQPRLNYAELPRIKRPGEGKGPITWKSVKIVAVGGAIMLGILKYMEAQKDAGKMLWHNFRGLFILTLLCVVRRF